MVKILIQKAIFTMGLLFAILTSLPVVASNYEEPLDSIQAGRDREAIFQGRTHSLAFSHFTWGAEAGSSLDMTSHDLSSFDIDVLLGYKNSFLKMAGFGAGIHRSIHAGNNFIPVYAVIRTDFRNKPSPFFMNLQAGYSFNNIDGSSSSGNFYGAIGLGINLKQSRLAKSYVIASLAYQYFTNENMAKIELDTHYIIYAKLVIGVNF